MEPIPKIWNGAVLTQLTSLGKVYLYDKVASTQEIACRLLKSEQTGLVVARTQTKGRGRFHRHWYSPEGGLWFSLALIPPIQMKKELSRITLLTALSVIEGVEELVPILNQKIQIRWPNDLVVSEKKLGGILCEAKGNGLVVGVGVNVNQISFPYEIEALATSLYIETGVEYNLQELLSKILERFQKYYSLWEKEGFGQFMSAIKERSKKIQNQRVVIELWLRRISGTVIDIDDEGRLILRTDSGRLLAFSVGKVKSAKWER